MEIKANKLIHKHIVDDLDNSSLTVGKNYFVIGIEGDSYRIIDDAGDPLLYTKGLFDVIDSSIPSDWVETIFDEETYIEPPETSEPGFYEDYFDDIPDAIKIYNALLKKLGLRIRKEQEKEKVRKMQKEVKSAVDLSSSASAAN